jgi:hypothetical protein
MTTRRQFVKSLPAFAVAGQMILEGGPALGHQPAPLEGHYHPKRRIDEL